MKRVLCKLTVAICATLIGLFPLNAESITSVLKEPDSYQHKRVQLVGVLRGDDGPIFELYANSPDAVAMKSSKSIRIVAADDWKARGPYDLRRVRVTGIIDAGRHGTWGNPCSLSLETIKIVSGPVAPWPDVAVIFKNESPTPISLFLNTPPFSHSFEISPNEYAWKYVTNDGTASVKARSGSFSLIGKTKMTVARTGPYYDPTSAALYYRITAGKIEQVLPSVAKNWGWRR